MIPKIIHYCWFGKNEKPKNVRECILSWKKKLPDYKFIEWNEENFDISFNKYTLDAYNAKKYAFVSDVARLNALYEYGGIYLDTDVVVFKNFDSILDNECVFGFEEKQYIATSFMACESHNKFIREFLDYYSTSKYGDMKTNVVVLTDLLLKKGLKRDDTKQKLTDGIVVYPQEFFSPYDYINCVMKKSDHSICAHLFYVSWEKKSKKVFKIFKSILVKVIGIKHMEKLRSVLRREKI